MSSEEKQMGMVAHLSALAGFVIPIPFANILGPLIIAFIYKDKDKSEFVKYSALEALNFQITIFIAAIISGVLCFVFIGFILLPIVIIVGIVLPIIGGLKAYNGEDYLYPKNIRFIKNI